MSEKLYIDGKLRVEVSKIEDGKMIVFIDNLNGYAKPDIVSKIIDITIFNPKDSKFFNLVLGVNNINGEYYGILLHHISIDHLDEVKNFFDHILNVYQYDEIV